jgi:hypothetical protein
MQASKIKFGQNYAVEIDGHLREVALVRITSTRTGASSHDVHSVVRIAYTDKVSDERVTRDLDPQDILGEARAYQELVEAKQRKRDEEKRKNDAIQAKRERLARALRKRTGIPEPQEVEVGGFARKRREANPIQTSYSGVQINDTALDAVLKLITS